MSYSYLLEVVAVQKRTDIISLNKIFLLRCTLHSTVQRNHKMHSNVWPNVIYTAKVEFTNQIDSLKPLPAIRKVFPYGVVTAIRPSHHEVHNMTEGFAKIYDAGATIVACDSNCLVEFSNPAIRKQNSLIIIKKW